LSAELTKNALLQTVFLAILPTGQPFMSCCYEYHFTMFCITQTAT